MAMKDYLLDETKRKVLFILVSTIALIISFVKAELPIDLAWVAILLCGLPIIKGAVIGLLTEFDIKADVLVSLALLASVIIGETFAAAEIAVIMQIGALLEDLTAAKAQAGIAKLISLTPRRARRVIKDKEEIISAEKIKKGDLLRVLPGEIIAADGILLAGETAVDQSLITGESFPIDKTIGDEVICGTVNQFGTFEMKAIKVGEDSSLARMIHLMETADASKAKIVGIADRWATWIVVVALLSAGVTWYFSGEIIRAVTIMVVFCPCALVLATPTAIMAAIGNVARYGLLVREGDALERLAKVKTVTFDKTGTLTYGRLEVKTVRSLLDNFSSAELYDLLAAVEQRSEHPLGKAVVSCYQKEKKKQALEASDFKLYLGQGVLATVQGKKILAGNKTLLVNNKITCPDLPEAAEYLAQGCTLIYIVFDGQLAGFAALSDTMRSDAPIMLDKLRKMQIEPVLLTGDSSKTAYHVAEQAGIKELHAECLPEDKLEIIGNYQKNKKKICMIGDGINDAPALKKADVGIAMGKIGSDIAIDAADIVLVSDEIENLPHLFRVAKRMMVTIKLNMILSLALNFIAIFFAIIGLLNPIVGALVHNMGSVLVIINSVFLLKWQAKM